MLVVIIAQLLMASASCQDRCAEDSTRCYTSCGRQDGCMRRCDDRAAGCTASCNKDKEKAFDAKHKPQNNPCPTGPRKPSDNQLKPCTEEEAKQFKEAMEAQQLKQALKCKSPTGVPIPCKDEAKIADEMVKAAGGKDAICMDANGQPTLCPDAKKRVEAQAKSHAKKK